jgi:hypothetical protein
LEDAFLQDPADRTRLFRRRDFSVDFPTAQPAVGFPMQQAQTNVRLIYLEVHPEDIAAIKFVFEAYEEVAIVRTVDRRRAIIVLLIAPDFYAVARAILASLQRDFPCREIERPPEELDDWLMREVDDF